MREWRKVTKPEELVDGQRVRYSYKEINGDGLEIGSGLDERFFLGGELVDYSGNAFGGKFADWVYVEALFDDGVPVCRESAKPKPVSDGGPASAMTIRDMAALAALEALVGLRPDAMDNSTLAFAHADAFIKARG